MSETDGRKSKQTRSDVRVTLSLSPELHEELKNAAKETATPLGVLIRQWTVERLRQWQRKRRDDE